jgi:hypothetical protein
MEKLDLFKRLVANTQKAIEHERKLYKLGVDIIDWPNNYHTGVDDCLKLLCNEAQEDFLLWWFWDRPGSPELSNEAQYWDENNKPVLFDTYEKVYAYFLNLGEADGSN